ncbi:hypothetical protein RRG08_013795 [Elysia crispata]|uniref:NAD(P)H oxidase (H(2)O(2)-forming) n=1 Tax=Elysia crispata TaxID=231223 RepID=A0AAE1BBN0_9GAST|nr:hypothetical protein RRG08_013795 [Elysia crispata]
MQKRDGAFDTLKRFFETMQWTFRETHTMDEGVMWREATTMDQRKKVLAKFFKSVLSELSGKVERACIAIDEAEQEALMTKLTRTEFADALGLQANSLFVRNMFLLVDSSGDGFVSFDEFKTYFAILCSGDGDKKAEMFFQMFDTSRTGKMSKANYKQMIKSLLELNDETGNKKVDINAMVDKVFREMGKEAAGYLTVEDFKTIMLSGDTEIWQAATFKLDVAGVTGTTNRKSVRNRAKSFVADYKKTRAQRVQSLIAVPEVELQSAPRSQPTNKLQIHLQMFTRYIDNHRRQIFWVTLYTIVLAAIFIERAYYYSVEREHGGLRRLAGFGVSVTRGAASAQMFTYASLLVTMSRNTLTYFRETFLHRFIPFDNFHDMHIYVAFLAILFTIMHVIGHLINFYHISTQTPGDVSCYFREFFRSTHILPTFQYWTYETITGLTGVLLVIVLVVMYVFAMPFSRRNLFNMFSLTHRLYIVTYILMFLHGSGRLVQPPLWGNFFIGPMVLFLCDKFISVRRNKVLLPVHKAKLLPSGVINLVFKRPLTFDYQSGQWIRIACPVLGKSEYHPFTLTSAPHEEHLSLHIRAVGPWTDNLRKLFEVRLGNKMDFPKIYVDGPFGESHQDWYRYPVAVLVGGGIGITPFASILKDIANRSKNLARVPCQKVYFIWVTRTQRSFEWMTDIIRQVEVADTAGFVDVKICITQLKEKFDLRTTMLYICERHFQKVAGLSMFTGLRAKTHFGRPKFSDFFEALKIIHNNVNQIGVFSCGPGAMTRNVNTACVEHNAFTGPSLIHHFENF